MSQPGTSESTPFHLRGNFAPIFEEFTETHLEVTGSIPPELCGRCTDVVGGLEPVAADA